MYSDAPAIAAGTAWSWIEKFVSTLRSKIPSKVIALTVKAEWFDTAAYPSGSLIDVNNNVGNLIDFYIVEYTESTYEGMFTSSQSSQQTAVNQLVQAGIPLYKIVLANNVGSPSSTELGNIADRAFTNLGWFSGIGLKYFASDQSGLEILNSVETMMNKFIQSQI